MALAVAPFAAQAETWNIYGWQNHSWEFIDIDGGRSFDRTQSNAGNIGFAASVPTGMNDLSVNVQCEQFTFYNHFGGFGDWCNRNSKIGLSHPMMGEIMMATWLLPYNEGVAQWVDPFYDAGADSHTSIMGSVGGKTLFYNTGFGFAGGQNLGFNRRQENIIQYWSPNWNGFVFRFAWTVGNLDETDNNGTEIDPVIRSSSLAYTNGPLWAAVTWQDHEDWSAAKVGQMQTSDAESIRLAARYIMDMGDGMSVQLAAMYEDLEYEFNGVTSVDKAMAAFGFANFGLHDHDGDEETDPIRSYMLKAGMDDNTAPEEPEAMTINGLTAPQVQIQKTYGLAKSILGTITRDNVIVIDANTVHKRVVADDTDTDIDESATHYSLTDGTFATTATGTDTSHMTPPVTFRNADDSMLVDENKDTPETENALAAYLMEMGAAAEYFRAKMDDPVTTDDDEGATDEELEFIAKYDALKSAAQALALPVADKEAMEQYEDDVKAFAKDPMHPTAGHSVKIERDAWMVSGKIKFGGPVDFRFSYMDADDLEISCNACTGDWDETAAQAWNVGVFYTMPAGTELRLTYSEVDNDDNGSYDFGIGGVGAGVGGEVEMFAVGIVHWFD